MTKKQESGYEKYKSQEWVDIQIEMEEDENSGSITDNIKQ